eukprot:6213347-Pleurochrysis_carterae.AAC.2
MYRIKTVQRGTIKVPPKTRPSGVLRGRKRACPQLRGQDEVEKVLTVGRPPRRRRHGLGVGHHKSSSEDTLACTVAAVPLFVLDALRLEAGVLHDLGEELVGVAGLLDHLEQGELLNHLDDTSLRELRTHTYTACKISNKTRRKTCGGGGICTRALEGGVTYLVGVVVGVEKLGVQGVARAAEVGVQV